MANDRTTSAREFLFADSNRDVAPERLSDWLIKDLKGARRSSAPPPPEPVESRVEMERAEAAPEERLEAGSAEASDEPAALAPLDPAPDDGASPELAESSELAESRELAESLSYAREDEGEDAAPGASPAPEAVETEAVETKVYADPEDWLDDDRDSETTAAFFTPRPVLEEDDDALGEVAPAELGESLSPQVLAPEGESDDSGAIVVAGIGGSEWWKVAAGVAAALLLLFMVVHRTKKAPQAAAATHADIVAPAAPPANAATVAEAPAESAEPASEIKNAHGEYFGGSRSHMSSASDSTSQDPALPGGPSVARFPDLPREILMQLEQAFEAGEQQHAKSATDSIERY
jgi:hypothetical protein